MVNNQPITKHSPVVGKVKKLYKTGYALSERISFTALMSRSRQAGNHFLAFYDHGLFVGFAYFVTVGKMTMLQYLVVQPALRSRGYGTDILKQIRFYTQTDKLLVTVPSGQDFAGGNHQQQAFYLQNGLLATGAAIIVGNDRFTVLSNFGDFTKADYLALYNQFTGHRGWFVSDPVIHLADDVSQYSTGVGLL